MRVVLRSAALGMLVGQIRALRPTVIVLSGGPGAAERLRGDPTWRAVDAVAAGRVYSWPALPYGWGGRPPSVNRLPGVMWLAYVAAGRAFDDPLRATFAISSGSSTTWSSPAHS